MNIINTYFYNRHFPVINDIVFVKYISSSIENGAGVYVSLIEYNNLNGFILGSEITKYKSKPEKIFKKNKIYPCYVTEIDNNVVNLSYLRVKQKLHEFLEQKFIYIQKLVLIFENLNKLSLIDSNILISNTLYLLFDHTILSNDDFDIEKLYYNILYDPLLFFPNSIIHLDILSLYLSHMKNNIVSSYVELYLDFSLTIFEPNAPSLLINVCSFNIQTSNVIITYIIPKYRINIKSDSNINAISLLNTTILQIQNNLKNIHNIHSFSDPFKFINHKTITYNI